MSEKRVLWSKQVPEIYSKLDEVDGLVAEHLDITLLELVKLRSSILNGCSFCVDLHTRRALKEGESQQRLFLVSAWYEAGEVFTDAERAALALTDEMTRLGDHGVSDEVYDAAAEHFDDKRLAALKVAISMINLYNRLAVSSHLHPRPRKG
ncbi:MULTISPECIES: carboxymuconolactone decarboxylase family protein [Nocardiopsis]|uniref:Carboxymuconolactone decarboxylase family protein n=1 Tax=Nocardiopsis lambiniae TaxID=3075539 RepID=A0ABU2M7J0_9ACTN|nr:MULTISPECIES: carboxymuconolactone decarboxylase family protein [unclassified Nocardiopsis]MDE3722588.1 carboxymuconolactone decarboxylase family protein [Nocardiopsis sp. N85]MDT0328634.1 carboxymuconolactone decarboxylase family protein [Nocardiopsis sp. DSM 44743]